MNDSPTPDTDMFTELWAAARTEWAGGDYPTYGSTEWCALHPDDPKRLAAAIAAAEAHRRYCDEEALLEWFRSPHSHGSYYTGKPEPFTPTPTPVHATPGWPVRIPGTNLWMAPDGRTTTVRPPRTAFHAPTSSKPAHGRQKDPHDTARKATA